MRFSGTRLRALREERSLTLRDIATELGVTSMAVSRYENGQREPRLGMIESIASYFDVPSSCLIERDNMSMDEIYRVNFEKELAREFAKNIANHLMKYLIRHKTSLDFDGDPVVVLLHHIRNLTYRELHTMTTVEEVRGIKTHLGRMMGIVQEIEAGEADSKSEREGAPCPSKTTPKQTSKKPSKPKSGTLSGTQAPAIVR
jgi:transcriptional regulator with XRE-family HTH domain